MLAISCSAVPEEQALAQQRRDHRDPHQYQPGEAPHAAQTGGPKPPGPAREQRRAVEGAEHDSVGDVDKPAEPWRTGVDECGREGDHGDVVSARRPAPHDAHHNR
jgi:hypothetical protein